MSRLEHRAAGPGDAGYLVDFVMMAGEGLPELAWADMAEPGESLRDVGLRRAAREQAFLACATAASKTRPNTCGSGSARLMLRSRSRAQLSTDGS